MSPVWLHSERSPNSCTLSVLCAYFFLPLGFNLLLTMSCSTSYKMQSEYESISACLIFIDFLFNVIECLRQNMHKFTRKKNKIQNPKLYIKYSQFVCSFCRIFVWCHIYRISVFSLFLTQYTTDRVHNQFLLSFKHIKTHKKCFMFWNVSGWIVWSNHRTLTFSNNQIVLFE